MSNKIARVIVHPSILESLLQLPGDVRIIGANWNSMLQSVELFLSSASFPETKEGELIPTARVDVATVEGKTRPFVDVQLRFNVRIKDE